MNSPPPSQQKTDLVERINRIVRDRGDVELFMKLDQIMDKGTDSERAAVLGAVVKEIGNNKQKAS